MTARVIRYEGHADIWTPYNSTFVEAFKADLPWFSRRWDKDVKAWTVDEPFVEDALRIVRRHYSDLTVDDRRPRWSPPPSSGSRDPDRAELFVTPDAPTCVVEAAYRALAKAFHPDLVGPSGSERMQRINAAYSRVKEHLS
jgi:hypothetical protein